MKSGRSRAWVHHLDEVQVFRRRRIRDEEVCHAKQLLIACIASAHLDKNCSFHNRSFRNYADEHSESSMGCGSLPVRMIIHTQLNLEWSVSDRFFSIPEHILPEIKPSSTLFGRISKGVLAGIPVGAVRSVIRLSSTFIRIHIQVLGDQQAALVGQRCWSKGTAKSTCVFIEFFLIIHSLFLY